MTTSDCIPPEIRRWSVVVVLPDMVDPRSAGLASSTTVWSIECTWHRSTLCVGDLLVQSSNVVEDGVMTARYDVVRNYGITGSYQHVPTPRRPTRARWEQ